VKKFLLIATALLALTGGANAVEMPREFRGSWCEAVVTDEVRYSRNPTPQENCETYDSGMTVTAAGYTGHKAQCAVTKIARRRGHYRIEFNCQAGELTDVLVPLDRHQTWHLERGKLVIK
jgi:hypothetical protein